MADGTMKAPPVEQYGRIYTIRGNQTYTVNFESGALRNPYGILLIAFDYIGLIYATSSTANLILKVISGTGSSASVSGRNITFGSDSNRQFVVICPNRTTLTYAS